MEQRQKRAQFQFKLDDNVVRQIARLREFYRAPSLAHTIKLAIEDAYNKMMVVENERTKS